jgi:hypothetical protein
LQVKQSGCQIIHEATSQITPKSLSNYRNAWLILRRHFQTLEVALARDLALELTASHAVYVAFMLHGAAAAIWKSLEMSGIVLHMSQISGCRWTRTKPANLLI